MNRISNIFLGVMIAFANLVCSNDQSGSRELLAGFMIGTECWDQAVTAMELNDGHYLVLGRSFYCNSDYDPTNKVYIAKTTLFGDTVWNRLIQDSISLNPTAMAVAENGEIIICGNTSSYYSSVSSGLFLIKTDPQGLVIWKKIYPSVQGGQSIKITSDGNYIVSTNSANYTEPYSVGLIALDTSGSILWEKLYERDRWETSIDIALLSQGCLLITNYYYGYNTPYNYSYLFRTDVSGDTLWTKILDSINVSAIHKYNDSIYVLVGSNNKFYQGQNTYTVQLRKIDSHGNVLLANSVKVNRYGLINSVVETPDSSFLLAGSWNGSKPILMKWDRQGKWVWTKLIEDREWASDYKIYTRQEHRYLLVGTSGNDVESDIRIIAIDENGNPE